MTKSRILVVDDEPNLSQLVRFILERTERFEVCVENRSAYALQAARKFKPDLILLDVSMPGKDGGEVAREIEADLQLRTVPILFLTSVVSRAEAGGREITRAGKRFLAKPVDPTILVRAVDRVLANEVEAA